MKFAMMVAYDPLIVEFDFLKASEKDYKKLADSLYENYEKLDGLVHVAGVLGYLSPVINTSLNQLKTVMQVNFESNFFTDSVIVATIAESQ